MSDLDNGFIWRVVVDADTVRNNVIKANGPLNLFLIRSSLEIHETQLGDVVSWVNFWVRVKGSEVSEGANECTAEKGTDGHVLDL